jgi:hypothetical protein
MTLPELEETVRSMRALGVVRFGEIELGPEPPPPPPEAEAEPDEETRLRAGLDRMLRSSGLSAAESFIDRWRAATAPGARETQDQ